MSGPKSANYRVSRGAFRSERESRRQAAGERRRAAEEEARKRVEQRHRLRALGDEVKEIAAQWRHAREEHGDTVPAWRQDPEFDRLIQAAADRRVASGELAGIVDSIARKVAQARREFALQSALSKLHGSLSGAGAARPAQRAPEEEKALNRHAEQVSDLLDALASHVSNEERQALAIRGAETIGALPGRRNALLLQLRQDVQRANTAAKERLSTIRQVRRWRQELAGLDGPQVEELDRSLRRVVDGEAALAPNMAQRVKGVVLDAGEALKREYASRVIVEELQQLGYEVEVGFETASGDAAATLLRKPAMPEDYHVELRGEAGQSRLHARIVREADGAEASQSAERKRTDAQTERAWCGDFAAALAAAERRGVHARLTSRLQAGQRPVETIAPLAGKREPQRGRRRRKVQPKARSRR